MCLGRSASDWRKRHGDRWMHLGSGQTAVSAFADVPWVETIRDSRACDGSTVVPPALHIGGFVCRPRWGQPPVRHLGRTDGRVKRRIKLLSSTYLSQGAARPHTAYQRAAQHQHWTFTQPRIVAIQGRRIPQRHVTCLGFFKPLDCPFSATAGPSPGHRERQTHPMGRVKKTPAGPSGD
jgi:hypothetical protein